jgi:tetratricopeptide (TPR) repeat protein
MSRIGSIVLIFALLLMVACTGDPHAQSIKMVDNGNRFFDKGKYKEASIMYRRAISKDAKNGDAYYRLGLTSLKLGSPADAVGALRRAVDLQPNNIEAITRLADIYWLAWVYDRSHAKTAISEIEELSRLLLNKDAKSFDGLRLSGYAALANERLARETHSEAESKKQLALALSRLEQANQVKPLDPNLCLVLVQTLAASQRPSDAEALAKQVVEKHKDFAPMYDLLLASYFRSNRLGEAEQVLQQKVQNNPKQEAFRLQLASFYFATKRPEEMQKALQGLLSNKSDFPMARLSVGQFYMRIRDFDAARRQFDAGVADGGENKAAYQRASVELLWAQGKYQEASSLVSEILKADPKDTIAIAQRAALALQSRDPNQVQTALTDLQGLVSKNPANPVYRFQLARALLAKGQPDQAKTHLEEAIRLRPNLTPAKLLLAQVYSSKGDHARTLQIADEVISQERNNLPARLMRSAALLALGEKDKAKTELQEIIKNVPDSADAQYQLGLINYSQGNYKDAMTAFNTLREHNPGDVRGMIGMVETEVAQRNFPRAEQMVQDELRKDPDNLDFRFALANVLARAGQYDDSIKQFQFLIGKNPRSEEYQVRLAEVYRLKGDVNSAIEAFRKASSMAPNDSVPLLRVAMLLEGMGRPAEAKPVYEQILRLQPDNAIALNNLAYIKAEEGNDLDQALAYAQRAKQRAPADANISDTLGWIYIKKNLSDDAVRIFQELVGKDPNNASFRYHFAMALFQKGDRPAARKQCELALQSNPSRDQQVKIKELLNKIG